MCLIWGRVVVQQWCTETSLVNLRQWWRLLAPDGRPKGKDVPILVLLVGSVQRGGSVDCQGHPLKARYFPRSLRRGEEGGRGRERVGEGGWERRIIRRWRFGCPLVVVCCLLARVVAIASSPVCAVWPGEDQAAVLRVTLGGGTTWLHGRVVHMRRIVWKVQAHSWTSPVLPLHPLSGSSIMREVLTVGRDSVLLCGRLLQWWLSGEDRCMQETISEGWEER